MKADYSAPVVIATAQGSNILAFLFDFTTGVGQIMIQPVDANGKAVAQHSPVKVDAATADSFRQWALANLATSLAPQNGIVATVSEAKVTAQAIATK